MFFRHENRDMFIAPFRDYKHQGLSRSINIVILLLLSALVIFAGDSIVLFAAHLV